MKCCFLLPWLRGLIGDSFSETMSSLQTRRKSSSSLVSSRSSSSDNILNSASWASLRRLKVQEFMLVSSANSVVSRIPNAEESDFTNLLLEQREKDTNYLKDCFWLIKDSISSLKKNMTNKEKIKSLDVNSYKTLVYEIERRIDSFKIFISKEMDALKCDERRLKSEFKSIQKPLSILENEGNKIGNIKYDDFDLSSVLKDPKSSIASEVVQFQTYVKKNGGHTGGWGQEQHNIFVCIFNRLRKQFTVEEMESKEYLKSLNASMISRIPDLLEQDVIKHDLWYEKYIQLSAAHKQALIKWKSLKSIDKYDKQIEAAYDYQDIKAYNGADVRKQLKVKIKDWREKKEKQRRLLNLEKAEIMMKFNEEHEASKLNIKDMEKMTEAKKLELEARRLECDIVALKNKERRGMEANKKIKEFRIRDEIYIARRRAANSKRNSSDFLKPETGNSGETAVKYRVNYRKGDFRKPTEQWLHKTMDSKIEPTRDVACFIEDMPKLAIPNWRKGINLR